MIIKKGAHPRTQFEQEHTSHLAKKNEADLAYLSMMLDVDIPQKEEEVDGQVSED
jgi:hypothetical protein